MKADCYNTYVTRKPENSRILAQDIYISPASQIGDDVLICAIDGSPADRVFIGDHVRIAPGFRAYCKELIVGDWCTIHGPSKVYGYDSCRIGECTWIGQDVILNCTGSLIIGRGCIISAKSSIWTHFTGGDPVQGCRFHSVKQTVLHDDVWIGVGATIAPITAGEKSMALSNAAVTRDMLPNHVYGGVPAVDLTDKLGAPYEDINVEEKLRRLTQLLDEFERINSCNRELNFDKLKLVHEPTPEMDGCSIFNVSDRTYSKTGLQEEIEFMRFILPHVKFFFRFSVHMD